MFLKSAENEDVTCPVYFLKERETLLVEKRKTELLGTSFLQSNRKLSINSLVVLYDYF